MQVKVEKLPKATVRLTITVPSEKVKETYAKAVAKLAQSTKVAGFRPGKAPPKLVEEKLDQAAINGEVVNLLVPETYSQALKEHHLHPIAAPKINLKKFEEGQELVFEATLAVFPQIEIGDYQKALAQLVPAPSTVVYGPDGKPIEKQKTENGEQREGNIEINKVLDAVLSVCKVEIPPLLVEEEVNRMLSRLLNQTQSLGLKVEDYLASVGKTSQQIRQEYTQQAKKNLAAEFVLGELTKREGIKVSESEIQQAVQAAPDKKSRAEFEKERGKLYIKSVLAKRKLLEKLTSYATKQPKPTS